MLGGMIGPSIDPVATIAAALSLVYPASIIGPNVIALIATAVAMIDPVIAPKKAQVINVIVPIPPGKRGNIDLAQANNLWDIPPISMM